MLKVTSVQCVLKINIIMLKVTTVYVEGYYYVCWRLLLCMFKVTRFVNINTTY